MHCNLLAAYTKRIIVQAFTPVTWPKSVNRLIWVDRWLCIINVAHAMYTVIPDAILHLSYFSIAHRLNSTKLACTGSPNSLNSRSFPGLGTRFVLHLNSTEAVNQWAGTVFLPPHAESVTFGAHWSKSELFRPYSRSTTGCILNPFPVGFVTVCLLDTLLSKLRIKVVVQQ